LISLPILINSIIFKKTNAKINKSNKTFYNWRFGKIRYIVKGRGEPLLLIHDTIAGSGAHEWDNTINDLSKHYTVYAIDLLGYGFSDKPEITYSAYLYVSLINDFIANIIKKKTSIVVNGNSSGFAILANTFRPNQIKKIILVSPHGIVTKNEYPNKIDRVKRIIFEMPIIGTSLYTLFTSKVFSKIYLKRYIDNMDSSLFKKYYYSSHCEGASSKYSNAAYISNYLNTNITKHLSRVKTPIHIIWGKGDEINPLNKFNHIIENCPTVSLSIFDTKSLPHIEAPVSFYKTCKMFLAG
jgi:pimeloyl-ACP methyl ester carboxylesterase